MADTLDVLTLAEGKGAIGLKSAATNNDTLLAQYITAVSRRLDKACGAVVTRTVTEKRDGGTNRIRLKHPVSTFTSVTEYQQTTPVTLTIETLGTAPGNGYIAEEHAPDPTLASGVLLRRSGGFDWYFWPGRRNIVVAYTAGRYGSTAAVDARFKEAAAIILANLWGTQQPTSVNLDQFDTPGSRFPKFGIPNAARHLLHDEWRETPGIA